MDDENDIDIVEEVKLVERKPITPKKCFICEVKKAEYYIKGEPEDSYCEECATEAFGDLDCLVKF